MRLTSENTALVLDSGSDLDDAEARNPRWRVVPAYVYLGGGTYRDREEISPEEFYRRLRSGREYPRTSQPSPGDFEAVLTELGGLERVLVVTASSKLSGIHDSALLAARATGDHIRVLDSGTVSGTIVLLADALQRRLDRGTTDDEVDALVDRFRREARYVCALDTIDYLVRGGRVGKAAGLAAGLAGIKPIVQVVGGEIAPLRRVRGRRKLLAALERVFGEETDERPGLRVGVAHADALDDAERLADVLRSLRPRATLDFFGMFGPGIGSHSGPGAVALFWFRDEV
jgi:DegV family protein with EDD domain